MNLNKKKNDNEELKQGPEPASHQIPVDPQLTHFQELEQTQNFNGVTQTNERNLG